MKLYFVLLSLFVFGNVNLVFSADVAEGKPCWSEFKQIYSKDKWPVSLKDSLIRQMITKARAHYVEATSNNENVYVDSAFIMLKKGKRSGYRMVVTDGGDESNITYYFSLNGSLILARWSNQTSVDYWVCE
ncbi:MAG: hypothetical protein AABZ06_05085 [Bdellovibrionota bacterium]